MSGLPDPVGDKEGRSETDSQMSGSEDQKSNFDKDLNKVSKSSHSVSKNKKTSKKARNRWYYQSYIYHPLLQNEIELPEFLRSNPNILYFSMYYFMGSFF